MNKISRKSNLSKFQFGLFLNEDGPASRLGIYYFVRGKLTMKPLILAASEITNPRKVMNSLIDVGADIHPVHDMTELKQRLKREALIVGVFSTKLGWFGDYFLMPDRNFGESPPPIAVEPGVRDLASLHFNQCGHFDGWRDTVARLATKSSYCMFAIMMAIASVLLSKVLRGNDEGFICNFAGGTSRGKTTALIVGKSVSGGPKKLISWGMTKRKLCEQLAAASDTLLAIDDLDTEASRSDFGKFIADVTHLLASGSSMVYSNVVKAQLPDLHWSAIALTCAKDTVENLSRDNGYSRSPSDRVRLFDIPVPDPAEGGIWDRMDNGDSGSELTIQMQKHVSSNHGTALIRWLDICVGNPKILEDTKDLIAWYVDKRQINASAGIEQRIAAKFGLIFAAGILAAENGIVPWHRDDIESVVVELHGAALATVYDEDDEVESGLKRLQARYEDQDACTEFDEGCLPSFPDERAAANFIRTGEDTDFFFIEHRAFENTFSNEIFEESRSDLHCEIKPLNLTRMDSHRWEKT